MKALNKLMEKLNEKLYRAVEDRNLPELNTLTDSIRAQIVDLYSLDNQPELTKMLHRYQKWLDGTAPVFDREEEKIAYQMGLLGGTVATVAQLTEQHQQLKEYEVAHLDTKYQDSIIELLMDKDYMQHNQLAKSIGISPSQLTTIMGRVDGEQQNIVSMSRVGKFKYYCLTDMGRRYYRNQHRGNFREEILELLKSVLDRRKSPRQNTIKKFVDRYYINDIELKQKAMEVEYFLDSLEAKSKGAFIKTIESDGGFPYAKRLMAKQFASNVDVPIVVTGNRLGQTAKHLWDYSSTGYVLAGEAYEEEVFEDMTSEREFVYG